MAFVAQMTNSLAWPLVVVVAVLIFRRPIQRLLTQGPPKRVKAGPVELEWDRVVAETENEVQAVSAPPAEPLPPANSVVVELAMEAAGAPAIAVLEAHAAVERELRSILDGTEPTKKTARMGAVGLARLANQHELISSASVRATEGISVLRNLAAHGQAREITPDRAAEYLVLADAVLYALREDYRQAREHHPRIQANVDHPDHQS